MQGHIAILQAMGRHAGVAELQWRGIQALNTMMCDAPLTQVTNKLTLLL